MNPMFSNAAYFSCIYHTGIIYLGQLGTLLGDMCWRFYSAVISFSLCSRLHHDWIRHTTDLNGAPMDPV